jgi:DNA polymerase-1
VLTEEASDPGTLYIVDGHAQFFRAYYAIRGGMSSSVTNEPTHMVYGFVSMLAKLLRERRPGFVALVIDAAGDDRTFRSQIYPEYKANRQPAPLDFGGQVERCLQFVRLIGIPVYAVESVEADDVIATIARRVRREHPQLRVRIVSRDKDLAQLVDERTTLFDPQTGTDVGPDELFESKGIRASQVADMLALMGDASDNIPGVDGIGIKTAAQLITTYGSLDGLLANLEQLTPKRREAIEKGRTALDLSRRLVALKDDCDVKVDLNSLRLDFARADRHQIDELLRQLGFGRLQSEVHSLLTGTADAPPTASELSAPSAAPTAPRGRASDRRKKPASEHEEAPLFAALADAAEGGVQPPALERAAYRAGYECLRTASQIERSLLAAREAAALGSRIAFDTETDSLRTVTARLCGVSLSWREGQGVYIPCRSPEEDSHCNAETVGRLLKPFLEDASVPKVAHNAKFDLQVLRRSGVEVAGLVGDSMVASYVLDASRSSHGLDGLAQSQLGYTCISFRDLVGSGTLQRTFDQVALSDAVPYAAEDADIAGRLDRLLTSRLDDAGLGDLYRTLEMPLVSVLADLEWNGIRVDKAELDRQCNQLSLLADGLRARIIEAAPHSFNPDSPKQLSAVLFNQPDHAQPGLGLRSGKRTQGGLSTGIEVLEKLASDPSVTSELPTQIIEYRKLRKLVGTYLEALKVSIEPTTGRIHASFHQTGTATGRLSSSDPNMQNIPIRTEVGREVRKAFVAPPGCELLSCDYSQIELRVLAHLAEDPAMIAAFEQSVDIHTAVAAEVHGIDPSRVTPDQRSGAKMVNFGIIYGITPWGLARRLGGGTTPARAKEIIDGYRRRFSRIDGFLRECVSHAKQHGWVATMAGRRRAVPQVLSPNGAERALGERMAINSVVQGSAADIMKAAMVRIHRGIGHYSDTRMLLQIHDELVFEVPAAQLATVQSWVVQEMESAARLKVPLVVESSHGINWFDAS